MAADLGHLTQAQPGLVCGGEVTRKAIFVPLLPTGQPPLEGDAGYCRPSGCVVTAAVSEEGERLLVAALVPE